MTKKLNTATFKRNGVEYCPFCQRNYELSNGWKPPQEPALKALGMNIDEATERACKESTLLDALTFICIWESERVVKQARENKTWETCFRRCLKSVLDTYVKVEPAEKSSNKDFLRLPIGQRRKLLKEQVEAFLKTNPDFRVNDGELAPCPLSEQCHDDMMADCEHCPYRRYAVAQLAHNKARMRKQLSELQGVCDRLLQDNTELTEKVAKMVKLPSEDELQADIGSILIKMRCEEHLDVVAGNYVAGKIAQELLKLLRKEP